MEHLPVHRHRAFETAELGEDDAYALLNTCVAPRPIAFVSTESAAGLRNLAPFSWFMAGGLNPPSVAFSPSLRDDLTEKDTLRNIRETGEYVINVVSHPIRAPMNLCSLPLPPEESEWDLSGLTPAPSQLVKPARVAECLLAMECRLHQIVPHGRGPSGANYVIGEVVCFHVAESLLPGASGPEEIDPREIGYLARLSGSWYQQALPEALFQMPRLRR